jgi:endo-alpha-1,4-polygalactosaminidase (GH114 family)
MPAQSWTWECCSFSVIFSAAKGQLEIEVTDGEYEAHYRMDKSQFKVLVNACDELFDNDFMSTMQRVKKAGKFEDFVHSLPKSGTVQAVFY